MALVNTKIPPSTSSSKPGTPATVPEKYSPANTAASAMRMSLSVDPMFFFISDNVLMVKKLRDGPSDQTRDSDAEEAHDYELRPPRQVVWH